jgi:hypothetical protein
MHQIHRLIAILLSSSFAALWTIMGKWPACSTLESVAVEGQPLAANVCCVVRPLIR